MLVEQIRVPALIHWTLHGYNVHHWKPSDFATMGIPSTNLHIHATGVCYSTERNYYWVSLRITVEKQSRRHFMWSVPVMALIRKRKGSETDACLNQSGVLSSYPRNSGSDLSVLRSHFPLEDYARLRKKCKEDVVKFESVGLCKTRLTGAATVPPCGISSLVPSGRGLKRKIGCINVATQIGRKNKFENDYALGETIGQGKFGLVWLCGSRVSGVEFACKTLMKGEETVHKEVEIMQHLSDHPAIVTLPAFHKDPECFHLVMELCSGGRLVVQMAKGHYSEHWAANKLKELILAIKYCHDMGVVHRDIKPENILLTAAGLLKLGDFGLAMRIAKGLSLSGLAGSPAYVAPEVLSGSTIQRKVDIWSAGVLHAFLFDTLSFRGDSLEAVFEASRM